MSVVHPRSDDTPMTTPPSSPVGGRVAPTHTYPPCWSLPPSLLARSPPLKALIRGMLSQPAQLTLH